MICRGKTGSNAMLCFRSILGGESGAFLRLLFVQFLGVRSVKDSCNDWSGDFLLTTSKGNLNLCYPILHSNQPYTIIQFFLPSKYTPSISSDDPGVCRQLQQKRTFVVCFCFLFLSPPFSCKFFRRLSFWWTTYCKISGKWNCVLGLVLLILLVFV